MEQPEDNAKLSEPANIPSKKTHQMRNIWAWGVPSETTINGSSDAVLFSSSLPSALPFGKLPGKEGGQLAQPIDDIFPITKRLDTSTRDTDPMDDVAQHLIGDLLPDDEEELLAGVINDFDHVKLQIQAEESEEYDVFFNSGGMELDVDPLESITFGAAKASVINGTGSSSSQYGLKNGVGTVTGEHPYGEHPSRTLFVRNINSNVEDSELHSLFEVKKQSSCSVHLVNKSNEYVAFKVKTTSPKRYCVRPNTGVILPRATCDFTVTMQAQRTAPPDMQLKDKFLVQTTAVPPGTSDGDLVPAFFSKDTNEYIEESKLRVVLISASHSLVEQLTNGVPNTEAAVEVPVLKDTLNFENEVPAVGKEVPPPLEQTSAIATEIPSPVKETPMSPILREVPVPLHEAPAILTESPPLKNTPAITIEQLPPVKENTATLKESPSIEETPPKEAVTLSDRGLFNVQNHQLSHVTEDVQNLKSKLNNLESKLEESEKMIIKLREESRTTTEERDKLQQEMVFLRKKGTPKSQVGFPLLFVVYVALLGASLGYLLRL